MRVTFADFDLAGILSRFGKTYNPRGPFSTSNIAAITIFFHVDYSSSELNAFPVFFQDP